MAYLKIARALEVSAETGNLSWEMLPMTVLEMNALI